MRAIEYTEYGPPAQVLRVIDAPTPTPGPGEVRLRVRAASVNAADWRILLGKPWFARLMVGGLRRPAMTCPGFDVAGEVEAVGAGVTRFRVGDAVFGTCRGAFTEQAIAKDDRLAHKPANVSFVQAAAVPLAATTALQGLRDHGHVEAGQQVLVDGASGGVGTFAVQIAKALGAHVTAVCSPGNVATARSLGADHVVDYTREDFSRDARRYDLVFAANAHRAIGAYRRVLRPHGVYVMAGGGMMQIAQAMLLGPLLSRLGRPSELFMTRMTLPDLETLAGLLASGALVPVIDRRYPLEATADAMAYAAAGHAKGKVVIDIAPG
jgi:NADPH:quinone reductase-like Zn-dependent oxidoreductase